MQKSPGFQGRSRRTIPHLALPRWCFPLILVTPGVSSAQAMFVPARQRFQDPRRSQRCGHSMTIALAILVAVPAASILAASGCKSGSRQPAAKDGKSPGTSPAAGPAAAERDNDKDRPAPGEKPLAADVQPHAGFHEHASDKPIPFVECPVTGDDADNPDKLLDRAWQSYEAGELAVAYSCADVAAAHVPNLVDAHHLRAVAASALGRYDVAQVAFALALALDPDDPETLAAAAEFYINILVPRGRDTTRVGLEYARRGRARAVVRRRTGRALRARLALLEAQGYNDLGQGDDALERVEEALELDGNLAEARYERGVALFNLCRFDDALVAFRAVLAGSPNDPYVHHHLGLLYERMGLGGEADRHFRRARELAPGEFWPPVLLSPEEFRGELDRAVAELPDTVRARLAGVALEVVDLPATSDLVAVDPPFSPTILGLFRGLPYGMEALVERGGEPIPPRAIVLYRKNLARAVKTRQELDEQIRRTLQHEIGHLDGLEEDDLRQRGLD